ncbi:hypothetical protein IQ07DRAFT_671217 [Pyrenochaeta sp. DS3sAY3a]|nr:hypothetical protein IQ07DRAFT_671217 [Pyrenochaeta sp. DS3sAY3a]
MADGGIEDVTTVEFAIGAQNIVWERDMGRLAAGTSETGRQNLIRRMSETNMLLLQQFKCSLKLPTSLYPVWISRNILLRHSDTKHQGFTEDCPDALTSMANLEPSYHARGRWNDAEIFFVRVMEIHETKRKTVEKEELRN